MRLGFIGTGALTAAIVTGLRSLPDNDSVPVLLSPRNEEIAAGLTSRFPHVSVAADNQAVLDDCDTIMLAVRPQVAREVLSQLKFSRGHHVVSLIAIFSPAEIAALIGPVARVTKALPIPMVAHHQGATIICPPDPVVAGLFGRMGKVIEVEDLAEFDALSVVTASFATYFTYLGTIHAWLKDHGVADAKARDYVAAIFQALSYAPETMPEAGFRELARDFATRGGINEQVVRELEERRVFAAFAESLDNVHQWITKR